MKRAFKIEWPKSYGSRWLDKYNLHACLISCCPNISFVVEAFAPTKKSERTFAIEWPDYLGPLWMNDSNLLICLDVYYPNTLFVVCDVTGDDIPPEPVINRNKYSDDEISAAEIIFGTGKGTSLLQVISDKPIIPTYILKWGENMPQHISNALQEGESALLLDENGEVYSMVIIDCMGIIREKTVDRIREENKKRRF